MIKIYAVKELFYPLLHNHTALMNQIELHDKQFERMFCMMDKETLHACAQEYFQTEITMQEYELLYLHTLKECSYKITIKDGYALLDDEQNPFMELIRRKYRWWIACPVYDK